MISVCWHRKTSVVYPCQWLTRKKGSIAKPSATANQAIGGCGRGGALRTCEDPKWRHAYQVSKTLFGQIATSTGRDLLSIMAVVEVLSWPSLPSKSVVPVMSVTMIRPCKGKSSVRAVCHGRDEQGSVNRTFRIWSGEHEQKLLRRRASGRRFKSLTAVP